MSQDRVFSAFLLERYHLGEVTAAERAAIEAAMAEDEGLAASVAALEQSDREILRRYPPAAVFPEGVRKFPGKRGLPPLAWGLCAAALMLGAALPVLFRLRLPAGSGGGPSSSVPPADFPAVPPADRIKGPTGVYGSEAPFAELSLYLKSGFSSGQGPEEAMLPDEVVLHEGNTVQLAYMVSGGDERYGVIFSIDGRAALTVHYPYQAGQSTRLVTGRWIALDEAYTLDDAPDYEVFFFVVSGRPLDAQEILKSAAELAREPGRALDNGRQVFAQYQLRTVKVRKE
jgi:hypothetical protein